MKKYLRFTVTAVLAVVLFGTQASAQKRRFGGDSASVAQRKAYRQQLQARYDSLSPEQKKEIHQKMRARLVDSLPGDKRKELRKAFHEKYKALSPEEKRKLRDDVLKAADSTGAKPIRKRRPAPVEQ